MDRAQQTEMANSFLARHRAAPVAEVDLAVLVCMGHMPTAHTVILTAMAATTTTAAAI
jgi:hypothetical protein